MTPTQQVVRAPRAGGPRGLSRATTAVPRAQTTPARREAAGDPTEARAWARLAEPAPRGRYEHARSWEKRNRRRASFVRRVARTPGGCWVWQGQRAKRGDNWYPAISHREPPNNRNVQRGAFVWMTEEFFPELVGRLPHRTSPTCGEPMCVSPLHRGNLMVTNNKITAEQAVAVYQAKGSDAAAVAKQFGISRNQVLGIWRGRYWGEVTGAPKWVSTRKVIPQDVTEQIAGRKGLASSRVVAEEFGVSYKSVLRIWSKAGLP